MRALVRELSEYALVVLAAAIVALMLGAAFFFAWAWYSPRSEAVRRETYENSRAYREGVVQEVADANRQYATAPSEQRAAIRAYVLMRVADFPDDELPGYLRVWVEDLRAEPPADSAPYLPAVRPSTVAPEGDLR